MSYEEIVKALPGLTQDQLADLRGAILALLEVGGVKGNKANGGRRADGDEGLILSCISHVLAARGVEHSGVHFLRKAQGIATFREKLPPLMKYLTDQPIRNRIEQKAILMLGIGLLYDDLSRLGIPATGRVIMQQIHRVPAVLNAAFPGYAEAGMLGFITQATGKGADDVRAQ